MPTRAGFIDTDQVCGLGLPVSGTSSKVTLAGAKGAAEGALGAVLLRPLSYGTRLRGDGHAAGTRASLAHGCPPRAWRIVQGAMHAAALACRERTRVTNGGQPTSRKSLCLQAISKIGLPTLHWEHEPT
jgi:hypothetical protein